MCTQAPFSLSGFSVPVKLDEAIGPAALTAVGAGTMMRRLATTAMDAIRLNEWPERPLRTCASPARGKGLRRHVSAMKPAAD